MGLRRLFSLLPLVSLTLPVALVPLACDNTTASPAQSTSDAGPLFEPDSGSRSDSSTPNSDGGIDAAVAPSGVTVTVLDDTKPFADVRVLFHDATGAVNGDQKTDAAGKVTAKVAPAMVTVIPKARQEGSVTPVTYLGVAEGDSLVVVVPPAPTELPTVGNYSVTLTPFVGALQYGVLVGGNECGGNTTAPNEPFVVGLVAPCLRARNAVLAFADNDGTVGMASAKNIAKPAQGATVNVGPLVFAAPGTTTIKATNLPAPALGDPYVELFAIANEAGFSLNYAGSLLEGGAAFATATGFAEAYEGRLGFQYFGETGASTQNIIRREATTAPATATLAFDFVNALPQLTSATITQTIVERPEIKIGSAASTATADLGVVTVRWGTETGEGLWKFVVPPGTTTFKAPALPADAKASTPVAGASWEDATFIEGSAIPTYKEAKSLPISSGEAVLDLLAKNLPAAGTLRTTSFTRQTNLPGFRRSSHRN